MKSSRTRRSNDYSDSFVRYFKRNHGLSKNDFLNAIHWFRQILAVLIGLFWGVIPMTGYAGNIGFLFVSISLIFLYTKYMNVENVEFSWTVVQEGLPSSYGLFCLTWILSFTFLPHLY